MDKTFQIIETYLDQLRFLTAKTHRSRLVLVLLTFSLGLLYRLFQAICPVIAWCSTPYFPFIKLQIIQFSLSEILCFVSFHL